MDRATLEKNLKELDDSYEKVLDNMDGLKFKEECKDSILLSLDMTTLDKYYQGILNVESTHFGDVLYRIKYMPSDYVKFIRIVNKMILKISEIILAHRLESFDIVNKVIIFGNLTYGFEINGKVFKCKETISFDNFLILQDVMVTFVEDYLKLKETNTLDELDELKKSILRNVGDICNEEFEYCQKNIIGKIYANIRNLFRKDIVRFAETFCKVLRGEI